MVQIDALTQLFNRAGWLSEVEESLAVKESASDVRAALFIDLDRFKWVNDSLGHGAGDLLLQKVARLIESCVNLEGVRSDKVGRFGGDEFVVWVQHPDSLACLDEVANRIVRSLSQPICLMDACCDENTEVEIGASIGVARYPQDAQEIEGLLKLADLAMYRAKHSGRNQVVFYRPEMIQQIEKRRQIQIRLRKALRQQRLALEYLPLFDTKNQTVVAIEAKLSTDAYPELEGVEIDQLLSIADESQVGVALGEWMIQETICFSGQLLQEDLEVSCAIEVRPNLFQQKEFVNWLAELLETHNVPPESLIILLSDGCLNSQRFSTLSQLTLLSKLGVEIAVRSFGSGSWPLLRLYDWPIDRLGLNPRFVQEMTNNRKMSAMTGSLIEMGLALNKKVIARGITSAEQVAFLNSYGCFLMEGPYLKEALSKEEMEAYLLQGLLMNDLESLSPYYGSFSEEPSSGEEDFETEPSKLNF